jgi:membrane-associated phospholipid phosphatase
LVQFGPAVIDPAHVTGVVAFPSYHMIMALLAFWYARRTPLAPLFVLTGLGMVPATLSHGGHHLVDLIGGTIVFAASALLACRLFPAEYPPQR